MHLDHWQTQVTLRALRAYELDVQADPDLADDERAERLRDTASARAVIEAAQEAATEHRQDGQDERDRETAQRDYDRALGDGRH